MPNVSLWILGDQLHPAHPGLQPGRHVVLIESLERLRLRPYHKRKLGLILAAMRHYAAALQARGFLVDVRTADSFLDGLRAHCEAYAVERLVCMAGAEYTTRRFQESLAATLAIPVDILPNTLFLSEQWPPARPPKRMEPFYREMRKRTGLLMEPDGQPTGGVWNFDRENRKRYDGRPVPPPLQFAPDATTRDALADIERLCADAIGSTADFDLPVTRTQALQALADFVARRLPDFGPFEDAMSTKEPLLFHSLLSPLLNIGLLEPLEVCRAAVDAYAAGQAPLASVEGFVRQIIGWREYVYLRYWELMPELLEANAWQARRPLPDFFWSGATRMHCLNQVIERVLQTGYSHHIERLMLICNFALLAGLEPAAVNAWFLECYVDAYEWVVTPNVIGMGLNADDGQVATKPYIASAAYINRMSDYCRSCRYRHNQRSGPDACPFNLLYWNFLAEHETRLRANPRSGPAVLGLKRIDPDELAAIRAQAANLLEQIDSL
jgi:deoxyribodipyrimidine photolyase-related protein